MKKLKKKAAPSLLIGAIILTIFVIGGTFYFLKVNSGAERGTVALVTNESGLVDLSLSPETITTTQGVEQTIQIMAAAGIYKTAAIQAELTYDPSYLGTPVVTQGDFYPEYIESPVVQNGKITFVFNATAVEGGTGGSTGSGVVATIKINPIKDGTTNIGFTSNTIVTSPAQNGNVLHSVGSATIVVGQAQASATASPTATATSSPTSSPTATPTATPTIAPTTSPTATPDSSSNALTTQVKLSDKTCNAIYLKWDKVTGAQGYTVDLADNSGFNNAKTSGQIGSDQDKYYFGNLKGDTDYYARLTIASSTKATTLGPIKTTCQSAAASAAPTIAPRAGTVVVTPKPKATVTPTKKPVASAKATPQGSSAPAYAGGYVPFPSADTILPDGTTQPITKPSFIEWIFEGISNFFNTIFETSK